MVWLWVGLATVGLGLVALLVAERLDRQDLRWATKPLASTGFLVVALALGATGSTYGLWVLAGLALSWVGDVFLVPRARGAFLVGIVGFLSAHLAYGVAFVVLGQGWPWTLAAALGLALVAWPVARWLLPMVERALFWPVVTYMVVISGMVALAVGAVAVGTSWVVLAGAGAFYLSDLTVARDRFVEEGFVNRLTGLPLYYGAQVLLAWSVALT